MICPDCHGNGYWTEKSPVMQKNYAGVIDHVRQCETCNSQGEIEESKNAKTDED